MWTIQNRPRYNRGQLRYPSDLTDEEWALVEPMIPPAKHGGRRRTVVVREVVDGGMYVLSTGCQPAAKEHGVRLPDALALSWRDREAPSRAVCWQEGHGKEAAHLGRYVGIAAARHRPSG